MPRQVPNRDSALPVVLPRRVDNTLSIDKYYRSANLLVRQAGQYRAEHDEFQLYTMLMRLASLIVETIPAHKDYKKDSPALLKLKKDLREKYFPEVESLKVSLKVQMGQNQDSWRAAPQAHAPGLIQITTSNLPSLDWGDLPSVPTTRYDAANTFDADLLSDFSLLDVQSNQPPQPVSERVSQAHSLSSDLQLPTFKASTKPISQAARDRHALMPSMSQTTIRRQSSSGASTSYPTFDASPWRPIDYRISSSGGQDPAANAQPSAPPLSLSGSNGHSLMDLDSHPQPSLRLGPQELEVQTLSPLTGPPDPNGNCSHPPRMPVSPGKPPRSPRMRPDSPRPPPPPPPPEDRPAPVTKREGLREVQIAVKLMEEFFRYASKNTQRNIESCGILAGKLDTENGIFRINTLIIPKQQGTSDTVQAFAEEEIFEAQDSRSLYPMGWIHTHPSQTCFLSSIDVHTQCGYQTMLDEAIAIVMAPTDVQQRCGIFRLNTPAGLKMVQNCPLQGFHHHPMPGNAPIYEICGHVFLNERIQHEVVDLR